MRYLAVSSLFGAAVCLLTSPVAAQTGPTPAGQQPKDVEIPGTLDPATGKFTPYAAPAAAPISVAGTVTVQFTIDPVLRKTTSLICSVEVVFVEDNGDRFTEELVVAEDGILNYSIPYNAQTNQFTKTMKPQSFNLSTADVSQPDTQYFDAGIRFRCFYLNEPGATVFQGSDLVEHLKPGNNSISIQGTMRD